MKIVQIGGAGHASLAYNSIKRRGLDISALAPGNAGETAEGTASTLSSLKRLGFSPKRYSDWREMLESEKPDIVIVNPWFNNIAECSIYALERNINVFSEKPLASSLEELNRLIKALERSKAELAGMFNTRGEPSFLTAKKAVEDGLIGEIRMMDSRKSYKLGVRPAFYSSEKTYCGILPWVAIHAIDWMKWLSGEEYVSVSAAHSSRANGGNGDMDITSAALFKMTNDVIATVTADMFRPSSAKTHGDDRVRLVGTAGIIEITDGEVSLLSDGSGGRTVLQNLPPRDIFDEFLESLSDSEAGAYSQLTSDEIESTRWALLARDSAIKGVPLSAEK